MKKWILSAIAYLLIVVGGYMTYEAVFVNNEGSSGEHDNGNHEDVKHDDGHGDHGENIVDKSEVEVSLDVIGEEINLTLTDLSGNPVGDLEVNHEKLLHLIVVSSDLEFYVHLHPEQTDIGEFKVNMNLPEGSYKAFVDIKPSELGYVVTPISFTIGEVHEDHEHSHLQADENLTKLIGSHSVTMNPSSYKAGEEIQLSFDLSGETPEPYLGALGHVVILDEQGEEYIHVHPLEGDAPVFATSFDEPGLYKIWAEFQFNGEVYVFPFVIEIHE